MQPSYCKVVVLVLTLYWLIPNHFLADTHHYPIGRTVRASPLSVLRIYIFDLCTATAANISNSAMSGAEAFVGRANARRGGGGPCLVPDYARRYLVFNHRFH